jgi:hypothetical protein
VVRLTGAVLVASMLFLAACDSSPETEPGTTSTSTTTTIVITTTTIDPEKDCRDLTADLVVLFDDIVSELEGFDPIDFADRARWSRELLELEALGVQLDERAAELSCDPGEMQAAAFAALDERDPDGLLAEWLLDLLRTAREEAPAQSDAGETADGAPGSTLPEDGVSDQ